MHETTRRSFLGATGSAALAVAAAPLRLPRWQPHNQVRVAVVGLRGRGGDHIRGFTQLPNVRVVAVVDVDGEFLDRERQRFADGRYGEDHRAVDTCRDLREVLERDDVDAVSIATPNHWHALQAIWACQAKKHVYVEKPVSHNVWEGTQLVLAARKYGVLVQAGTQCRSSSGIREGLEFVRSGRLGAITLARGLCYKPRPSIGKVDGPQPVPATVDYDLWCGPAPKVPLHRGQLHYDWRWDFATGNGDVGNQGIHQMDIARWALGQDGLPRHTVGIGGRVGYDDDGDTPNTQLVLHEFERGAPLLFEVRGLPRDLQAQRDGWSKQMDSLQGARIGVLVHCEHGTLRIPDYESAIALDAEGKEIARFRGAVSHYQNFVDAVRSGRREDLHAEVREGHVSSAMCHLGNVSHRLGERATRRELSDLAGANTHLGEAWERLQAHLTANGIDVDAAGPTHGVVAGRHLHLDPAAERLVDADPAAQALWRREYRAGFAVPEAV